jgi:hypothetical protein
MSKRVQWQWRNRGSRRAWTDIAKPTIWWMQMEYRTVPAR